MNPPKTCVCAWLPQCGLKVGMSFLEIVGVIRGKDGKGRESSWNLRRGFDGCSPTAWLQWQGASGRPPLAMGGRGHVY